MTQVSRRTAIAIAAIALASALAACGGSKSKATVHTAATTTTAVTANPAKATSPSVTTGAVRATLHGASHAPVVGKNWSYTVHVTDPSGKPLAGTVETDFVVSGLGVVGKETPATHKLKNGMLNDVVQFPAAAVGQPISLVTVVRTSAGSVALAWPVTVAK